jgi:hypothetical protein
MTPKPCHHQSSGLSELLHLSSLNAFGLAQPILDRLAANTGFLQSGGYTGLAVLASIALLLTAIPVSVFVGITVLRWIGWKRSATAMLGLAIGMLSTMSLLIVTRWVSASMNLLSQGIPDSGMAFLALCGGTATVWLYFRSDLYRQILCLCAAGLILFPLSFFESEAARQQVLGISSSPLKTEIAAGNPAPTVMIVFDGLCGMALLNEEHEIDRVRYPSFARLGGISSFYRNATTVHTRTKHALPAILSSCIPEEHQQPVEADYPTNLFRLIHTTGQYHMTVFEPFTHLYPKELRRITQDRMMPEQAVRLLGTLLRVYAKLTVPQDMTLLDVSIPKEWFGMQPSGKETRLFRDGKIIYGWDNARDTQCEHFVDCLNPQLRPGFRFLHVVLPHDPWNHLPSGKSYRRVSSYRDPIFGSHEEEWCADELPVRQAWQRYLLQLQFADLWLGRILDRLEETHQLDESLVVVTADHGMAFVPGASRRTASAATIPDIISVPLFIKQPHQRSAAVSDKNVETIDILPTIAEILDLPMDGAWAGMSVLRDQPGRLRKTVRGLDTVIEPDFPRRFEYVDRMIRVFGSGTENDRLWNLNTIPELAGTELSRIKIGRPVDYVCELLSGGTQFDPSYPAYVPCSFHGKFFGAGDSPIPRQLALAVNGRILLTTRTSTDKAWRNEWAALLPDSFFSLDENHVQLFEVEQQGSQYVLQEIQLESFSP